ncbi:MAG: hypothetical protein JWR05_2176 [Mucilaginibacter sp.]|nr:hypothetical protein [Mucilaginibacter sp.]
MTSKLIQQITVKSIPKLTVTDNVVSNVVEKQLAVPKFKEQQKENGRNIDRIKTNKNKPIVVLNPIDKSLICTVPIIFQGRLLIAEFPNLLTLYLHNAIESYNHSYEILNEINITKAYKSGDVVVFSNQQFYNSYLLNRINIIFYLSIALELLLNSKIPLDYEYRKKDIVLNRKEIEEKLPFKEKLKLVNNLLSVNKKGINIQMLNTLIELYSIRSKLVHPKTSDFKFNKDHPMDDIAQSFSYEIIKYINCIITVIKKWEPGLLSFEDIAK